MISPADIRIKSDRKFDSANYAYFEIPYWHQLSTTVLYFKLYMILPWYFRLAFVPAVAVLLLRFEGIAGCFQLYFYC